MPTDETVESVTTSVRRIPPTGILRVGGIDCLVLTWTEVQLLMRVSDNENLIGQDGSLVGKCRHYLQNAQAELANIPEHLSTYLSTAGKP